MKRPIEHRVSHDAPPSPAEGGASVYDVVIIGGGASGLAAAITSARSGARTAVIERDIAAGLGILATGNGRCNISNAHLDPRRYRHPDAVRHLFGTAPERDIEAFLASLGIAVAEEGEGRLYPITRRAESARDALLGACDRAGVDIIPCAELERVAGVRQGACRLIVSVPSAPLSHKRGRDAKAETRNARKALASAARRERLLTARSVILACGGSSEGSCRILGLPHLPEAPVLCPIAGTLEVRADSALKRLDGLRVEAMLTLMRDGAAIAFEQGEVLFRPYGISGIAAFNLSRRIEAGDVIELDLFPDSDDRALERMLCDRVEAVGPFMGDPRWFDGMLARPLAEVVVEATAVDARPLGRIASLLHRLRLRVSGTTEHSQAQVRRGGIPIDAVDLETMAVSPRPADAAAGIGSLFACGEAIDIDADCGGYNLAWAWLSGIRAGGGAARSALPNDPASHEETHA